MQYQQTKLVDDDGDKRKLEEKILSILSDPRATYDPDHALILSQMHGFGRGTLFLYEKKGLHDQVKMPGGVFFKLGANPTIASYNASVVNFYNAAGSLARFENKNFIFYF
jgi:hypothetical protein